jgi:16S rRNA (guanine527-N7)-methyltransferase
VTPAEAGQRLADAAAARGLSWGPGAPGTLAAYLDEVVRVSAEINLTGAKSLAEAVEVLGVPSLALGRAWARAQPPALVIDLGSGNGLPGVVAALAWPGARVLLVERRGKKSRAIAACCAQVALTNTRSVACDGRELLRERPEVKGAADLVLARGVGTLEEVVRMAAPWVARGGRIVQWKGATLDEAERRAGERGARGGNLKVLPDVTFDPPTPGPGRLVVYERTA